MPWKESCQVNERMMFVARFKEGERISDLCREFGISRKTGYKFVNRFQQFGPIGLYDEPRVALSSPHRVAGDIAELVVQARKQHSTWGPRKLRSWLLSKHPGVRLPAASTMGEILKRHGLVKPRKQRRAVPTSPFARHQAAAANEIWCADFKGQFRLGTGRYCYPLTISDAFSRYIVSCEGLEDTKGEHTRQVFEVAFREHGLPDAILTDNGAPFATRGLLGLSQLSVWWLRLGIRHERTQPGHPEQNGRHERMHRTLKAETTRPAAATLLQQQDRFDRFVSEYNSERPHEALGQRPPATLYAASGRRFPDRLTEPDYPLHDMAASVSRCGHISFPVARSPSLYLSTALAGQKVGLREVDDSVFLVSFVSLDLGFFNLQTRSFSAVGAENTPAESQKPVTDGPGLKRYP